MENKEKKEYGGCLRILLPLWFIGQILSIFYNLAFANYYTENPMIPVFLIGINLIELVGIILLLQFKKIGFYIFILSLILAFLVGLFYPDYVDPHIISKSIFGLGFFLLLMCFKNKETKLNGYQTLGIIKSPSITESNSTSNQGVNFTNIQPISENDIIAKDTDVPKEIKGASIQNDKKNNISAHNDVDIIDAKMDPFNKKSSIFNSSQKTKKTFLYIFSFCLVLLLPILVFFVKDRRTSQEIYENAKILIERQEYDEGIKELEAIQEDYTPAKALLGNLYTLNDSVQSNYQRGELLLREAYELNDTNACRSLFNFYMNEGKIDSLEIIGKKMLEIKYSRGIRALLILYYNKELSGKTNKYKDYKKVEYYALQNANNDAYACDFLGQIYSEGGDGVSQDFNKAFYWWNKGAKLGDTDDAMCYSNLGWLYLNGKGVNTNYKKAFEAFKSAIAINKTDSYSFYNIGEMFKNGQYVKANRDSAKYYIQKAAEYGDVNASVELENDF